MFTRVQPPASVPSPLTRPCQVEPQAILEPRPRVRENCLPVEKGQSIFGQLNLGMSTMSQKLSTSSLQSCSFELFRTSLIFPYLTVQLIEYLQISTLFPAVSFISNKRSQVPSLSQSLCLCYLFAFVIKSSAPGLAYPDGTRLFLWLSGILRDAVKGCSGHLACADQLHRTLCSPAHSSLESGLNIWAW